MRGAIMSRTRPSHRIRFLLPTVFTVLDRGLASIAGCRVPSALVRTISACPERVAKVPCIALILMSMTIHARGREVADAEIQGDLGAKAGRPNIVLIMTDDQGYGDVGFHGNPVIQTPTLDRLAREGAVLANFYVCPVCAPTRASLMTGRYHPRTGVLDTYLGRAMMFSEEVTIAELLSSAGYRTGIFGKWHLGDCYPMRPMDQGFQESLVHRGGGLAQPSDPSDGPKHGREYFDPILEHNGRLSREQGYCSDIFTEAALRFIEESGEQPFFVYLAFNAPHTPLQVPDKYLERFRDVSLDPDRFPVLGHPEAKPDARQREATARVYAMVENIDDNIRRLLEKLETKGARENTLVLFLTDNGPQQPRFNGGMLARKGSVHEGGIRVPCFVRWPARIPAGRTIETVAAHIDLLPTVLSAAGIPVPANLSLDGRSLLPLLEGRDAPWSPRTLFFQWHRGDAMVRYRSFAARSDRFKLVQPVGAGDQAMPSDPSFLLFDMASDPLETRNIADERPAVVAEMRQAYDAWFAEMESARHFHMPSIVIGSEKQDPVPLTRQDWRGANANWEPRGLGYWDLFVEEPASYQVTVYFPSLAEDTRLVVDFNGDSRRADLKGGVARFESEPFDLSRGPSRLTVTLSDARGHFGPHQVDVRRLKSPLP